MFRENDLLHRHFSCFLSCLTCYQVGWFRRLGLVVLDPLPVHPLGRSVFPAYRRVTLLSFKGEGSAIKPHLPESVLLRLSQAQTACDAFMIPQLCYLSSVFFIY